MGVMMIAERELETQNAHCDILAELIDRLGNRWAVATQYVAHAGSVYARIENDAGEWTTVRIADHDADCSRDIILLTNHGVADWDWAEVVAAIRAGETGTF